MAVQRRASLYIDDQKLAECSTSTLRINTNTERQHAQEGVIAGSDGNTEVDFSFDTIVIEGFPGASKKVIDAINLRKEVQLGYYVAGMLYMCPAKFASGEIKSDNKSGVVTGSWSAINTGNPTVA